MAIGEESDQKPLEKLLLSDDDASHLVEEDARERRLLGDARVLLGEACGRDVGRGFCGQCSLLGARR